jgi:hypothetical protein
VLVSQFCATSNEPTLPDAGRVLSLAAARVRRRIDAPRRRRFGFIHFGFCIVNTFVMIVNDYCFFLGFMYDRMDAQLCDVVDARMSTLREVKRFF